MGYSSSIKHIKIFTIIKVFFCNKPPLLCQLGKLKECQSVFLDKTLPRLILFLCNPEMSTVDKNHINILDTLVRKSLVVF